MNALNLYRLTAKLYLVIFFIFSSLSAQADWRLDIEAGAFTASRNKVQIPNGNEGDRFKITDLGDDAFAAGRLSLTAIGKAVYEWTPGWLDDPIIGAGKVSGTIITIDAFGNLISNIDQTLIKDFREPIAHIAGHTIPTLTTYGRAKPGDLLALINSFGVVEIAKSEGSAADGIGSERGAPLVITDGCTT